MRLPNGYGSVYKLSGSKRRPWIARKTEGWTDEGKQLYYTVGYYETRAKALAALAEYNQNPIGNVREMTLGEVYEQWTSGTGFAELTRSTANGYRAVWARFARLAGEPIRDIKTSHLQAVIGRMEEAGLSRSTLEKAKTLAGILFELAVNDDIIPTNYARAIKLPRTRQAKRMTFSDMELHKVAGLAESGDVWAGTILILIYTGLRIGELLLLTRFNVDVERRIITGGIKTDAGKDRVVPIHPRIQPYVAYWHTTPGARFIHRDGQAISVDYYRKALFYSALQRAGVERRLTPHATRHTFASLLDRAKVSTKHIQDLMGHSDYAVTANVYTHPRVEELRTAIEAI